MPPKMPLARTQEIIVQTVDGECLVYDLTTNKAISLNDVSTEIWKRCDGIKTIKEVAEIIGKQMNVKLDEDFIWLAISELEKYKLLAPKANRTNEFENLSRRKVLFKYALPGLMLPVISSIIAPRALHAQSGAPACNVAGFLIASGSDFCLGVGNVTPNNGCCSGSQTIVVGVPPNCNIVCT